MRLWRKVRLFFIVLAIYLTVWNKPARDLLLVFVLLEKSE